MSTYRVSKSYYYSPEWYALKDFIKALAGTKCELCGIRQGCNLHHWTYDRFGREHPADLAHICRPCHKWTHGDALPTYAEESFIALDLEPDQVLHRFVELRRRQWDVYRTYLESCGPVGAELIEQGLAFMGES